MSCKNTSQFKCVIFGEAPCARCRQINYFNDCPVVDLCQLSEGVWQCPSCCVKFDWKTDCVTIECKCDHCNLYQEFSICGVGRVLGT